MCIEAHRDTLRALLSMKLWLTASADKKMMARNLIVEEWFLDGLQKSTARCWRGRPLRVLDVVGGFGLIKISLWNKIKSHVFQFYSELFGNNNERDLEFEKTCNFAILCSTSTDKLLELRRG